MAKEDKHLIRTLFINGNHWFTVQFKLELDIINFVEKLNKKEEEEFKIIYLKGVPKEEECSTKTDKPSTIHNKIQDTREILSKKEKKTQLAKHEEEQKST